MNTYYYYIFFPPKNNCNHYSLYIERKILIMQHLDILISYRKIFLKFHISNLIFLLSIKGGNIQVLSLKQHKSNQHIINCLDHISNFFPHNRSGLYKQVHWDQRRPFSAHTIPQILYYHNSILIIPLNNISLKLDPHIIPIGIVFLNLRYQYKRMNQGKYQQHRHCFHK